MKKLLLFILCPFFLFGQTQIGDDINGEGIGDQSGYSLSFNGNGQILAVGAIYNDENGEDSGHVRVYENISGVWTQIGNDINGEADGDFSGISVSLNSSGNLLSIGAISNDGYGSNSGHVRVYKNISGVWTQIGNDINGQASNDSFGREVSLSSDGNILAASSLFDNSSSYTGDVRIFKNVADNWVQIGSDIEGESAGDNFGWSLELSSDGSIVAIGGRNNNGGGNMRGHVRIYKNISDVWTQIGNDINGEADGDASGSTLSLSSDGNIVAIGSIFNNNNTGHTRIYKNINDVWTQLGQDIDGEAVGDKSSYSLSLNNDGTILTISATDNSNNGSNAGNLRIFRYVNDNWIQIGSNINGEVANDRLGYKVTLNNNGNTVAVSSIFNDENGENSGEVKVFDLSAILNTKKFNTDNFTIFPNPTSNNLKIQLENSILQKVNIYNILGQLIKTKTSTLINIENLKSGIYNLEVITNKGKSSKKIIVN